MNVLLSGRVRWSVMLGVSGLWLSAQAVWATEPGPLKGASAVIELLKGSRAVAPTNEAAAVTDVRNQFMADLSRYTSNSASMSPAIAADAWLSLFDRFWALPSANEVGSFRGVRFRSSSFGTAKPGELSLADVYAAIPGPAAWPVLDERTSARKADDKNRIREAGLRVFTLALNQKKAEAAAKMAETLQALPKDESRISAYDRKELEQIRQKMGRLAQGRDSAGTVAEFEQQLDRLKGIPNGEARIVIPDLVSLVGTSEAARLIGKVVNIPNAALTVKAGPATRQLLKAAVVGNPAGLSRPQWGLVRGGDAIEYYEAMADRFSSGAESNAEADIEFDGEGLVSVSGSYIGSDEYEKKSAQLHYLAGLLFAGRQKDAVLFASAEDVEVQGLAGLYRYDGGLELNPAALFDFARALRQVKPDAKVWGVLAAAGMALGREADVLGDLDLPRAALSNPEAQASCDLEVASAYLALDRVEAGLALLRRVLGSNEAGNARRAAARKLVDVGCLLDRPDLVDESVRASIRMINAPPVATDQNAYASRYDWDAVVEALIASARYQQAEEVAIALLQAATRPADKRRDSWGGANEMAGLLTSLARTYAKADRHADVLTLLEKAPWWEVGDLVGLSRSWYASSSTLDLMPLAAAALLAEGRAPEACTIARTHLMLHPGDDEAYEVLVSADEPGLTEWLDRLYARDHFEERPLIWKAVCQLKAGQAKEAEDTIRQALAVDPTDGETKAGDRVRAYAVLADVLEAQGKAADAELFQKVVESVRLAEEGDALTAAGFLKRSMPLYDRASALFADAYCVQWRLAERLYATGHPEEAEKHYAIVFERMPEQFGKVASLCFGCEGIFDRTGSRTVAERILTRMATNSPVRPQVFFLLGQLREAQGRYPEAYEAFSSAVGIEPDYVDAWRKILEIADEIAIPQARRDEISLRMLKLDPLGAHSRIDIAKITDFKGLWEVTAAHQDLAWDPPGELFPLPASKAALEARRSAALESGDMDYAMMEMEVHYSYAGSNRRRMAKPGAAVVGCAILAEVIQAFERISD